MKKADPEKPPRRIGFAALNGAAKNPQNNETLSQANVYKALMAFSQSLLEEYHKALQTELAEQGIEI